MSRILLSEGLVEFYKCNNLYVSNAVRRTDKLNFDRRQNMSAALLNRVAEFFQKDGMTNYPKHISESI